MDASLFNSYLALDYTNSTTKYLLIFLVCFLLWKTTTFFSSRKKLPPGPFGLPIIGNLLSLGKEPHKTLMKMRQKYGDIIGVYLGTNYTVTLNSYAAAKEVYTHQNAQDRALQFFENTDWGLGARNGLEWTEQRKFCFSTVRNLGVGKSKSEDAIAMEIASIVNELKSMKGQPVDISDTIASSLSVVILTFLFGRRLDMKTEGNKIKASLEYSEAAFRKMQVTGIPTLVRPLKKLLEYLKIHGYDEAAHCLRKFENVIKNEVQNHRSKADIQEQGDFINTYLERIEKSSNSSSENYFSYQNLYGNLQSIFLGSVDTTHASLMWLLRIMAKYRDVQQKVYKELMDVLGKEELATYSQRHKIPYTFAVLMESQRHSSFAYLSPPRQASKDIDLESFTIPKGAVITVNLWALHRDPIYWKQPECFRPENFLTEDGTQIVNPPSFAPFSIGKRDCPGQVMAWVQIMGFFTEIIKHFEISTESGVEANFDVNIGLVNLLKPQKLRFKWRDSKA